MIDIHLVGLKIGDLVMFFSAVGLDTPKALLAARYEGHGSDF